MRVEIIKAEIQRLLRQVPFHQFALNLENGDRVIIEHPENIAFDPVGRNGSGGASEFHMISSRLRYRAIAPRWVVWHTWETATRRRAEKQPGIEWSRSGKESKDDQGEIRSVARSLC